MALNPSIYAKIWVKSMSPMCLVVPGFHTVSIIGANLGKPPTDAPKKHVSYDTKGHMIFGVF